MRVAIWVKARTGEGEVATLGQEASQVGPDVSLSFASAPGLLPVGDKYYRQALVTSSWSQLAGNAGLLKRKVLFTRPGYIWIDFLLSDDVDRESVQTSLTRSS